MLCPSLHLHWCSKVEVREHWPSMQKLQVQSFLIKIMKKIEIISNNHHTLMFLATYYFVHMNYHNNFEVSHSNEKHECVELNNIRLSNSL
ncbi:hypothetical protein KFK09_008645 [Dendrobium nobile]|uniref:Uncharacterized protein n=1 Tax=Dendrobium nobile TaxID=94219 RepID=A0A8T3BKN5_DENNO|nr:hypothetical protein KFK09_008645 [Dendrobium nobile]